MLNFTQLVILTVLFIYVNYISVIRVMFLFLSNFNTFTYLITCGYLLYSDTYLV